MMLLPGGINLENNTCKFCKYVFNLLIAIDQLANTILGGSPDETISSRASKDQLKGRKWAIWLCWALNKIDADHCQESTEADEGDDNSL